MKPDNVRVTRTSGWLPSWWFLAAFLVLLLGGCFDDGGPTDIRILPPDTVTLPDSLHWVAWIKENSHPIVSLTSEDYSDLQFLKPLLAGRRLVQLGEGSDGVAEHGAVRVRLIKFLHEEMGYDVVAFMRSLYGCFTANRDVEALSPTSLLGECSDRRTEERLPLFEYVKDTHQTERPLILAGFDYGPGYSASFQTVPSFLSDVVATIDTSYAQVVDEAVWRLVHPYRRWYLGIMSHTEWASFLTENAVELAGLFQGLVFFFDEHESELLQIYADDPAVPLVARQTAWSTAKWMDYLVRKEEPRAYLGFLPDSLMAVNADFLLEKLYPAKKIVVWTTNYHLLHDYPRLMGSSSFDHRMGGWLALAHRPELYSVALTMYEGESGNAAYTLDTIPAASPNSLEGLLHAAGYPYLFVDLLHQEWSRGSSWMFSPLQSRAGSGSQPRFQYDAILFVDKVSPAHYVSRY